jgi:hypothetical protein
MDMAPSQTPEKVTLAPGVAESIVLWRSPGTEQVTSAAAPATPAGAKTTMMTAQAVTDDSTPRFALVTMPPSP